jgi:Ni,Fe-hydrogenase III component G|uniref:NADH-quinone oxidoreductase subunit C n=1 Tax=candidate division WOR-3 bacterium TaxID=2052148 RepID=A0A7C6EGP1_UNCW3
MRPLEQELISKFPEIKIYEHSPRRLYITIPKEKITEVSKFLFFQHKLRLSICSGIDTRDGFEILYHFSDDPTGTYYTLKTLVPKDDPKIDSLAPWLPACNWIEREMHELLGIEFTGHPNLIPLLTAESWPKDKYPLRRDFEPDITLEDDFQERTKL